MITLTDGNKTIVLTKREMEIIEDGLREIDGHFFGPIIDSIRKKLKGLKYE